MSRERVNWRRNSTQGTWVPVYEDLETPATTTPTQPPRPPTSGGTQQKQAELILKELEYVTRGMVFPTFANPKWRAGFKVTLHNLGAVFSGEYKIISVKHTLRKGSGYEVSLEVSRNAFGTRPTPPAQPAQTSTTRTPRDVVNTTPPSVTYHTVVRGETLWGLAVRFYGKGSEYKKIITANPAITNPRQLAIGTRLIIP